MTDTDAKAEKDCPRCYLWKLRSQKLTDCLGRNQRAAGVLCFQRALFDFLGRVLPGRPVHIEMSTA